MRRHLATALAKLGRDRSKDRLDAVGYGKIAAARCKFDRQGPADAARRPRHRGGASIDRSHRSTPFAQGIGSPADGPGSLHFSQIGTEPSSPLSFLTHVIGATFFGRESLMGQSKPFRATA